MKKWILVVVYCYGLSAFANGNNLKEFFRELSSLEFAKANKIASRETDSSLRSEMQQLSDLLFFEGQIVTPKSVSIDLTHVSAEVRILHLLNEGYVCLFYDRLKGNAYKHFHEAYKLAIDLQQPALIKASLLAILKYYNLEIAQNSHSYLSFLRHYEELSEEFVDQFWGKVYAMIFYSKELGKIDDYYFQLSDSLDRLERSIDSESPLLPYLYYERAVQFDIEKKPDSSAFYYEQTIDRSKSYPFLRDHRFFSHLKLMKIYSEKKNYPIAQFHRDRAKKERNKADSLRSNYHYDLYNAFFLKTQSKSDSAFETLWQAYTEDFLLDFRRNTLEVNRLNVELDLQEKENANLRLRAGRNWLASALLGVILLLLVIYFAYTNQRARNKLQVQDKAVQAMKLEKVLKDQEIFEIDAMIEGQEKERQRIANDLHDNLGSILVTLKFNFQNLRSGWSSQQPEHEHLFHKTDELMEEAYQKVRSMAHASNVGVNTKEGLLPAVKNFAAKVSVINRLLIDVKEHGMDERLDNSREITIFRIIQELISNVIKHANATEAVIHLTKHDEVINLMVEDNGIGFDLSQIKPEDTMGLYTIQKKIESMGGKVTIDSIVNKGTTIIIDIPLA